MRTRWRVGAGLLTAVTLGLAPGFGLVARSTELSSNQAEARAKVLEIYVRSPVLVRAGERVQLPVQVVCATAAGDPCTSTVTLGSREGNEGPWRLTSAQALPSLRFDLSAAASRALGAAPSGTVSFFLRATGPAGRSESLPARGGSAPLQFYVTKNLRVVRAPSIPFGRTRTGRTALFLAWGSGRGRAGLQPGRESATLGPSSFDVDEAGRIYLADSLQDRVAVFFRGKPERETAVALGGRADLALADGGRAFILDQRGNQAIARAIEQDGRVGPAVSVGTGIVGQIRTVGGRGVVDLLPQDAWTAVSGAPGALTVGISGVGRPMASGSRLLRVITEDFLRLGLVSGDRVADAVEVRFAQRLGEVALAEPDGAHGYWAVVHVWRDRPSPVDQYQVIHVSGGRVVGAFAVGDRRFADTPPLARFRLGRDGFLYQLVTSSSGLRILRYDLGRQS